MNQMAKNSSLSHRVTNDLRRDIVAGAIAPGAWLKTDELAARYAVSANPVREALWRLQGEGFVVANPNQGARVRTVDDDFIRNVFEIREAIEPIFVRRFCQRATPGNLDGLRDAAAAFADVAVRQPSDFEALEAANRDFHAIILQGEFNIPAIETMERYAGIINATRAKLPITLSRLRQRAAQHREIVDAIAAGDANRAARAAIEHVRGAGEDLLNLMRQARMVGVRDARPTAPSAHGAGRATADSAP
jgi:DNA-binding GntR family transcriptional regulator